MQRTPQSCLIKPHKVVSGVETLHVEALDCSLYSVRLTIFKWSVVLKCSFAESSAESTVGQLSRKIIFGWGKKNKLAKGCSLQVASGSVARCFNSIAAQLDPVEEWGEFPCWTKSVIWRVWGGIFILGGRKMTASPTTNDLANEDLLSPGREWA